MSPINVFVFLAILAAEVAGDDSELKITNLSKCKYQIEAMGCYLDNTKDRLFDTEVLNSRDTSNAVYEGPMLQWNNYNHWLANFICKCATKLMEEKNVESDYIGLQYFGECWANFQNTESDHKRHGEATTCVDGDFFPYSSNQKCQVYMGQTSSNFVYKVSKRSNEETDCPYFTKRGCFKDTTPRSTPNDKPLQIYAMNERDTTTNNWNGHVVNWKKWGDGYLNGLLCRCAQKAQQMNKRFFGIQYYGECWVGDDESTIDKDGTAETCLDDKYKPTCSEDTSSQCLPKPCAGQGYTNMVYEVHQGPLSCMDNPCMDYETCVPDGAVGYHCEAEFTY